MASDGRARSPRPPSSRDLTATATPEEPPGGDETQPEPPPPGALLAVDPDVSAYLSTARGLCEPGLLGIRTLRQRLGEIRDDQTLGREGRGEVFVRVCGADYAAVQFGSSYYASNNEYGTLRVGLASAIERKWLQPTRRADGMPGLEGRRHSIEPADGIPRGLVMADRTGKVGRRSVEQLRFEWLNRPPRAPCLGPWY